MRYIYQVNEDRDKVCDAPPIDSPPVGNLTADDCPASRQT